MSEAQWRDMGFACEAAAREALGDNFFVGSCGGNGREQAWQTQHQNLLKQSSQPLLEQSCRDVNDLARAMSRNGPSEVLNLRNRTIPAAQLASKGHEKWSSVQMWPQQATVTLKRIKEADTTLELFSVVAQNRWTQASVRLQSMCDPSTSSIKEYFCCHRTLQDYCIVEHEC